MLRSFAPVPCVAVEIAPAIDLHVDVAEVLAGPGRASHSRRAQLVDRDPGLDA